MHRVVADAVVAGDTVADAQFGVVDEAQAAHELLLAQTPCEGSRGEIAPAVVGREFRRSVGAERNGEHVARPEAVIDASEPRHEVVLRQQRRHRVGQTVVDAADAERLVGDLHARIAEAPLAAALHRESSHGVEFVAAVFPVLLVGQHVLVHPVGPVRIQHRAVDAL